ncbi:MAG: helix-turn-helix transcriptional regulator [Lachnospiraceae bacterium]|nr:helix-turn-helix transcriptional regulator [Lachnospiraceae bacterium]MDD3417755.1 helix-turn-helix transcriptional regulator [Lachnospiraceae bacterium]
MKKKQVSLSTLRTAKGLSQRELSKELNFSAGLIGLYEIGKRKPSLENAIRIAGYFDTNIEKISFANLDK